jgi:hypothetical protein
MEFIGTAYNAFPQFSEAFAIAGEAFAVAMALGPPWRDTFFLVLARRAAY